MSAGATTPTPGRRPTTIPELLTVKEVAEALRLSRSKTYELIASGALQACRVGGRIRVPAPFVRQLIEQSKI